MKEIGILHSQDMVKAVLAGTKTVTRRTSGLDEVNENPFKTDLFGLAVINGQIVAAFFRADTLQEIKVKCRYGAPGDLLYVRETWAKGGGDSVIYLADHTEAAPVIKWKPSIHLPKKHCRIWLRVKNVMIERLREIPTAEAISEGIELMGHNLQRNYMFKEEWAYMGSEMKGWHFRENPVGSYMSLWDSINGNGAHKNNPWVWVISYEVLSTTGRPENV